MTVLDGVVLVLLEVSGATLIVLGVLAWRGRVSLHRRLVAATPANRATGRQEVLSGLALVLLGGAHAVPGAASWVPLAAALAVLAARLLVWWHDRRTAASHTDPPEASQK